MPTIFIFIYSKHAAAVRGILTILCNSAHNYIRLWRKHGKKGNFQPICLIRYQQIILNHYFVAFELSN